MSIEIHELTSEDVQRRFLAELTVERVRELAEQVGLDPASETPVDDFLAGRKIDHETILEFCTSYELKDLCRVLELPSDGGDADSLRKRIRTRLYFPPDADAADCPDALRDSHDRRARRRAEKEREFQAFQRGLVLRWGFGGGATLALLGVISPFQPLAGAIFLLPIGVVASMIIVHQQFGHVGGALTLGLATSIGSMVGAALEWCAIDLFHWAAGTALGGLVGIGAQLAGENPHPKGAPEIPTERRSLLELLRMLSEPRLNSLLLETDLALDPGADRDLLITQISTHAAFDRHRLVRSLDESELREVARRCGRPEGDDDLDEHQLRAVIERQFEIAFDVR